MASIQCCIAGLRLQDPSLEAAWKTAGSGGLHSPNQITEADIKASKSSWPIVMFLAVVFSGPYLIWRLLSSLVPARNASKEWIRGRGEHFPAQATHDFKVTDYFPHLLSLFQCSVLTIPVGDKIQLTSVQHLLVLLSICFVYLAHFYSYEALRI